MEEGRKHDALEFKTDGGRLIGLGFGSDRGIRDSPSNYLLVIDRLGLLEFLAAARLTEECKLHYVLQWTDWESRITTILPLEKSSDKMAWAVFGRRIVINAEAKTLPFVKSAVEVVNENEAEDGGNKNDKDQEDPDNGERLIVIDFGCHRLASVAEAGDASGKIIRSRTQGGPLRGVIDMSSKELAYRIWMERVPSCLPSGQVHMSESMVLVVDVSC